MTEMTTQERYDALKTALDASKGRFAIVHAKALIRLLTDGGSIPTGGPIDISDLREQDLARAAHPLHIILTELNALLLS